MRATTPCAIAYGYARIRRLVRLGAGLYRFPATANQWSGLVARLGQVAQCPYQAGHILHLMAAVRRALRRADFLAHRSTNLCTAASLSFSSDLVAASLI